MQNPFESLDRRLERIEAKLTRIAEAPVRDPTPDRSEKYLTVQQVCEMLQITRVSLWSWDKKGITIPIKIGNLKRYRLSDIEAMINQQ